jgi:hypothetical protein
MYRGSEAYFRTTTGTDESAMIASLLKNVLRIRSMFIRKRTTSLEVGRAAPLLGLVGLRLLMDRGLEI